MEEIKAALFSTESLETVTVQMQCQVESVKGNDVRIASVVVKVSAAPVTKAATMKNLN